MALRSRCRPGAIDACSERGVILVVVMLATALCAGMVAALTLLSSADLAIAANVGASNEAFFAADAALERTLAEVREAADLSSLLSGAVGSAFRDGPASGPRTLSDGARIDLEQVLSRANCSKRSACSSADIEAVRADRPWGPFNPHWRLFSFGPLDPAPAGLRSGLPVYVLTMVADDPAETDGDPFQDGVRTGADVNPGAGVILIRAEAFGRRSAHRVLEAVVVRRDLAARARWDAADPSVRGSPPSTIPVVQVSGWREVR